MGVDIAKSKSVMRAELRRRLRDVDEARMAAASHLAARRVCATDEFRRASAVMIFLPLRYEVDARPIALRAWQEGKTVTVPLVGRGQKHIMPVVVRGLEEPMDCDDYGVQTPRSCEPFPIDMLDLIVVPGLGFDREGHRLGRGGGYYDRFLAQPSIASPTCGLCIAEQIVGNVPFAEHDVRVDMVATDAELVRTAASSMMGP